MSAKKEILAIVQEANKRKAQQSAALTADLAHIEKTRKKRLLTGAKERYSVYNALNPIRYWHGWWYVLLLAITCLILSLQHDTHYAQTLFTFSKLIVVMITARIVAAYLYHGLYFIRERSWRSRLKFRVEGWTTLVDAPLFSNPMAWRLNCSIHIHYYSSYKPNNEQIDAILFMFCNDANHCFYPERLPIQGFAQDPRVQWEMQHHTHLKGSINTQVVREVHTLLQHLALLHEHQHYQAIESVLITVDEQAYLIPPRSKIY